MGTPYRQLIRLVAVRQICLGSASRELAVDADCVTLERQCVETLTPGFAQCTEPQPVKLQGLQLNRVIDDSNPSDLEIPVTKHPIMLPREKSSQGKHHQMNS
jgi:hypothetical protein